MQLVQIKYFLAACNTNNFTHAAKACNVTQPALTRSIGLLEQELGAKLFLREHHLTQLTPFGRMMLGHFERILAETERLRQAAKDFRLHHGTALNLGMLETLGPRYFSDLFRDFSAAGKAVQLRVTTGGRDRLIELLLDGTLHLALTTRPPAEDSRLKWQSLFRERFVLAFPEGHRFQRMKTVGLAELAQERHMIWCASDDLDAIQAECREAGLEFDAESDCAREDWALSLVAAGIGVTILPESAPPVSGTVTRPVFGLNQLREIHLVVAEGRDAEAPVSRFVRAALARNWGEQRRLPAAQ